MVQLSFLLYLLFCHLNATSIDKPDQFDPSWIKIARTNPNKSIQLLFALKQQNVNVLIDTLLNVSTPSHPKYGEYLSNKQIHEIIKPSFSTINTMKEWLLSYNISSDNIKNKTINGDFLSVLTTINTAQNMLNCNYYDYYNTKLGINHIISRIDTDCHYNIPLNIANNLDFISPTKRFPSVKPINNSKGYSMPYNDVTPPFINQLYHINNSKGYSPLNKQGIASFFGEYFNNSDIETFWNEYNITNNIDLITRISNNGSQASGFGVEATMNVQYMTSIGQSIKTEIWYTSNITNNDIVTSEPFLLFLLDILNSTNPPWLFIVSYSDYEFNLGYSYCSRCNTEFAKLGLMGITMLISSGDYGVGDDQQCCSQNPAMFCPMFPSSSPYITSVGGVTGGNIHQIPTGETAYHPSGGGFSNYFQALNFQKNAIKSFIELSSDMGQLPDKSLWNETGRGYPDIAAQSYLCDIIINNTLIDFSGTGCAVSIVGAIFGLLNDLRFQNNQTSLGWLNPFIYEIITNDSFVFNDIDCDCPSNYCNGDPSFHAITGWDAVTGFGTPNYAKLKQYVYNI